MQMCRKDIPRSRTTAPADPVQATPTLIPLLVLVLASIGLLAVLGSLTWALVLLVGWLLG